ncbi:hypothetical protein AWJ20_2950 [Sugiyamaella lignohabitans]|uniref:U6 small nuclear RNA (adenine-(43)-N(6))-methyltransferase n=1 Tax=Sugiyamaella lignohabitans TaxID=796027 RepID=A0A167FI06_9ASCO|nr:uncharacterized protein AWJ20_2950 [Sugiyamaella lignohabitans]ANB15323.1 hypothetical protein AWJ20_2950 [Sugiyamaella lignohabitans]
MANHEKLLSQVSNPDFEFLAAKYVELRSFLNSSSSVRGFDYSNPLAPYKLCSVLAKEYFDLDINLSPSHLCPRIANRLDYILWIYRLLDGTELVNEKLVGLDVGTGASCIYPLLGCAVFPDWKFYATEINPESIIQAMENCKRNEIKVGDRIIIMPVSVDDVLFPTNKFASTPMFTMCNPPFYESSKELAERTRLKSSSPKTPVLWANDSELYTKGGDLEFTRRMIDESLELKGKIKWYTTMVGKKETLISVVAKLKEYNIHNYVIHEISPGKVTKRWAVGWSFTDYHPRRQDARVEGSNLRSLNPANISELMIQVPNNVVRSSSNSKRLKGDMFAKLLSILREIETEPYFSVEVKSEKNIIVKFTFATWTRSFRRSGLGSNRVSSGETIISVEVNQQALNLNLWWKYGSNYKLFESFSGMLKTKLALDTTNI